MESIIVATALANGEGSLAPLRPYHVLTEFGGERRVLPPILESWLLDGNVSEGSPIPDSSRAGTAEGTLEDRKLAVCARLDEELTELEDTVIRQDSQASVYSYPVTWEIRDTVKQAMHDLRDSVLNTRARVSGV
jgi:hypothetical protein